MGGDFGGGGWMKELLPTFVNTLQLVTPKRNALFH